MTAPGYKVAELADSRIIAIEKLTGRALMLIPRPATGEFRLSRRGAIAARSGALLSITEPALCTGYRIEQLPSGDAQVRRVSVQGWDFTIKKDMRTGGPTASRFAILDLAGSGLLLARPSGLFILSSTPAPDGSYRTRLGFSVSVANAKGGSPTYHYADDFAP